MGLGQLDRPGGLATALATGLYLSYIPGKLLGGIGGKKYTGAGLIGTLEGWALLPLLPETPWAYGALLAAAILASCRLCGLAEKRLGHHDDPRIVLDEVVGFWTTAAFLPRTPHLMIAGFALFRFLDTVKLPPYGWLDRLPGGWGVVADDVGAGVVANILLRVLLPRWAWLHA